MPITVVLGKLADQRTRQYRHVARRGDMIFRRKSVRIDEVALRHAEPFRIRVHQIGETRDRSSDTFSNGDRDVVGGFDHQHLQRIIDGDARSGFEAHF